MTGSNDRFQNYSMMERSDFHKSSIFSCQYSMLSMVASCVLRVAGCALRVLMLDAGNCQVSGFGCQVDEVD